MSLPVTLPTGYVLVYGDSIVSNSGIVPGDDKWRFGSIYKIWPGGESYIYGGDQVMYDKNKVEVKLAANSTDPFQYQMLPCRLVTKQDPLL